MSLITSIVSFVILGAALQQTAASPTKFIPAETKVALVPVLNLSGEKWAELKDRQCKRGNEFLREEFTSREFQVLADEEVEKQLKALKLDFSDEEQQTRANLYRLGQTLEADLVMLVVITDTSQRLIQQLLGSKREGSAKMKIWLLDVKAEKPILSAQSFEGKSGGGFFGGLDKGSDRQVIAVANGLRDGLKDFFKPYPVKKKESEVRRL